MRPVRVVARGLTTLDLDLDLTACPPGLVAVVGPNGAGKSTLLDLLGPAPLHLALATKPGPLKDYCRGNATLDVTIDYAGHTYRHLVQVEPDALGGRGRTRAWLYQDGVPLGDGGTDGGVTAYEQAVARVYPTRDVFYASAFSAQDKRGNFFALTVPERKDLFGRLLGLGELQRLTESAGTKRKMLDAKLWEVDAKLTATLDATAKLDSLTEELHLAKAARTEAQARLEEATARMATCAESLNQARIEHAAAANRRAVALDRIADIDRVIAQLHSEEGAIADDIAIQDRVIAKRASILDDLRTAEGAARTLEQLGRELESLAARETDIRTRHADATRTAQRLLAEHDRLFRMLLDPVAPEDMDALPELRRRLGALDVGYLRQQLTQAELALDDVKLREVVTGTRAEAAVAALEAARAQARTLGGVPCGGRRVLDDAGARIDCGTCQFLVDAGAAASSLDGLAGGRDKAARERSEAWVALGEAQHIAAQARSAYTEAEDLQRRVDRLTTVEADVRLHQERKRTLDGVRSDLDDARRRRDEASRQQDEATTERARLGEQQAYYTPIARMLPEAKAALSTLDRAEASRPLLQQSLDTTRTRMTTLQQDRAAVIVPPLDSDLQRAVDATSAAHAAATADWRQARDLVGRLQEDVGRLQGKLDVLESSTQLHGALTETRAELALERAGLVLVEQAFGRDGIQALEIDAAGPEVSTIANELLAACFGPRFSLSLRTVTEAKGGRVQREVFDVLVLDGERAGPARPFPSYSGGEQACLDVCLRLALAVFNARRHGSQFDTLFLDELDGALDEDRAARYPSILRRALDLGGFTRAIFVSHRASVTAQADATILLRDGRATLDVA